MLPIRIQRQTPHLGTLLSKVQIKVNLITEYYTEAESRRVEECLIPARLIRIGRLNGQTVLACSTKFSGSNNCHFS